MDITGFGIPVPTGDKAYIQKSQDQVSSSLILLQVDIIMCPTSSPSSELNSSTCLLACPQHRAQVGNDTGLLGTGTLIGCALCWFLKDTSKDIWEGSIHANEDKHAPMAHQQQ